jgi:hypothetical protein
MTRRPKRPRDPAQLAKLMIDIASGNVEDRGLENATDSIATTSGRKGGQVGGPARAKNLTAERRSEIARLAALKRWGKD